MFHTQNLSELHFFFNYNNRKQQMNTTRKDNTELSTGPDAIPVIIFESYVSHEPNCGP